jgi:asparagine synthase (glutamine-hydrolysing)
MCGICGAIGAGRKAQAHSLVRKMLASLVRRGPDDEGILAKAGATLGMRRLSIIDLPGGHQPVYNEDGSVGVVFNGEIYNFPELRRSLEGRGHCFRTHSDTEVLVHAYEEWGSQCPERLRGMFAFAVWDGRGGEEKERVFLARDRLGIKPLYYAVADGVVLFASEVRALLATGAIARRVEPSSVEAYLLFGSVAEPMTLVKGVLSLLPGHSVTVCCDAPIEPEPAVYWDLAATALESRREEPRDLQSAARAARPLLEDAVRSHLLADVPLGVFLSSGIDSTALAALASRERRGLHTFTVIFPEQEFNEAPLARETAARLGTEHRELLVTAEDMQARLLEAVGALDQPSMDGVNTFFVSWAARQVGLKVALSGLGGDEVFAGYPTFRSTQRASALASLARAVPSPLRQRMSDSLREFARRGRRPHRSDLLHKLAAIWSGPRALPHPYFFTRALFTPNQIERLFPASMLATDFGDAGELPMRWWAQLQETVGQAGRLSGDSAVSCFELRTYTANTLLRDTDAMSMHHSLEVRVPLLDHLLVEFVLGLPDRAKRRRGIAKALLVEALGDLLPAPVARQRKRTFTFPWQRWLRGPLGLQVALRLGSLTPSLASLLDAQAVQSIWKSFLMARTGWARPWSLFVLNEWVRRNLDEPESPVEPIRRAMAIPESTF